MATRRAIRDAVYDDLLSAAVGDHTATRGDGSTYTVTIANDDVTLVSGDEPESYPAVVYTENYRPIPYNGCGAGPHQKRYNDDGSVDVEIWREYIEGRFVVDVRADSEISKEPIYESIRRQFAKYAFGPWPESGLHADVTDVSVEDANSSDTADTEDTIRGDTFDVFVSFYREFELDVEDIESIDSITDADLDDTTSGYEYTTT